MEMNERRLQQIRKLTEVSRALTYAVSLDEVLALTVTRAAEILDARKAVLMLTNDEGLLSVRAAHGVEQELQDRFREPLDETVVRRLSALLGEEATGFLGVPLVAAGAVIGILVVGRHHVESADEEEWLLSALADQAAVALEKTQVDEVAASRERMLGVVGHDLRNPLQAIHVSAQLLLQDPNLDERTARLAHRMLASSRRMGGMIAQLIDFTRGRMGGGMRLEPTRVDLVELVGELVEEILAVSPTSSIRVEAPQTLSGTWDSDRMGQAISNLIANAVDHGDVGSTIHVRVLEEKGHAVVVVRNSGRPIPADRIPTLFEPFLGQPRRERPRGLGLGLYIAKTIVTRHRGSIEVTSSGAEGTTFVLRFPLHPEILASTPPPASVTA